MENTQIFPSKKEHVPMARKIETPPQLSSSIKDSADKIGASSEEDLVNNLVDFKQDVVDYIKHFNISSSEVEAFRDDKKQVKGGFSKRAYQKHVFLGADGKRLVRDKLSGGEFLKLDEVGLYSLLLDRKLVEETKELIEAKNNRERVDKLSDVLEVFNTILSSKGIDENLIERKRQTREVQKRSERRKLSILKKK